MKTLVIESPPAAHAQVAELMDAILELRGNSPALGSTWLALAALVISMLDHEDAELVPRVLAHSPREVNALVHEHRHLRQRVAEIDTALERHALKAAQVRAIVEEIRAYLRRQTALRERLSDVVFG